MTTKRPPLQKMFAKVPRRYDLVNRIVTLGLDIGWRRLAVEKCLEGRPRSILDLCTGTGDMALELARRAPEDTTLVAVDFNHGMLREAEQKARKAGVAGRVTFELADAARLPFATGAFDAVGIAFGFRNLTFRNVHRDLHLGEIARIVKPGGRFVIAESSQPESALLGLGFRAYLRHYVGPVGGIVSGERGAYRYLAHSAEHYYTNSEVRELLRAVGFDRVETTPLLFGASAVHAATR